MTAQGKPVTAFYRGAEIEVDFKARLERCDFGVPRSPVWYEVDPASVEITALSILGVDVDPQTLPDSVLNAILDLADEVEFEAAA